MKKPDEQRPDDQKTDERQPEGRTLIRQLLRYLADRQYNTESPVKVILGLANGLVLRGKVVSPGEFRSQNTVKSGGSWPNDFEYTPAVRSDEDYVYLVDVEYLSGCCWVRGSTLEVSTDEVIASGDRY